MRSAVAGAFASIARWIAQSNAIVFAIALTLIQLTGCATVSEKPPSLLGRLHDFRRGIEVPREALIGDLASADFVLLGEVHDNAEHHRHQADVLRALLAAGRRPALAMEQLDREFQPAIDSAIAKPGATANSVADAGAFNRNGWDWPLYQPLLALAVDARLPVIALNLSRERTRNIARQGFASLGDGAAAELALDRGWTASQQAILEREVYEGHCRKLPSSAMPRMVDVQRARDATMADALLIHPDQGAVVIAGAGHVRNDVGMPFYLSVRAPAKRVVTVGLIEVGPELREVVNYARVSGAALPFDYVWFTPAAERDDPCKTLN